jgi:hypothetical protein
MVIISKKITISELKKQYMNIFPMMIKAVVDIDMGIMALDAELHADLEAFLIDKGSNQDNLWGINIYPGKPKERLIEFTALINIRPHQNNPSMEVHDSKIKERIKNIVAGLVDYDS